MIPLRKGAQYEEIRKLGKGDHLVKLKTSPQARKKWPGLGNEVTARLLTVTRKGKVCHLLTSMTDAMRFPGGEMADLYSHRWEIELGYRGKRRRYSVCSGPYIRLLPYRPAPAGNWIRWSVR